MPEQGSSQRSNQDAFRELSELRIKLADWLRVPDAARYVGSSTRSIRRWMKQGLRYSRLPGAKEGRGSVLISKSALDEFLHGFEVTEEVAKSRVDRIVNEICAKV